VKKKAKGKRKKEKAKKAQSGYAGKATDCRLQVR